MHAGEAADASQRQKLEYIIVAFGLGRVKMNKTVKFLSGVS